ncbi:Hypothetical predicted protein [Marmota monax]|uniref:long-chain-fatty-acid--CoA ligase n=1 Tax=Marmota monax TaxID=9995 RepID=A0A5E4AXP5_MARMO|nr:hypothetical protein GHT09_010910 [Marmota monax]VTJ61309.1 Hypothetical predicted protein [Marmota monax]
MFYEALDKYGDLNALGFKRQGKWEHVSYSQYYLIARKVAKGFLKLGLERAHSVAILGFNSPEWFFSAVGTVFAGGIVTGIYTTSSPEACQYIARDCRANIIVVDTQKQLEKILKWPGDAYVPQLHPEACEVRQVSLHSRGEFRWIYWLGSDFEDVT